VSVRSEKLASIPEVFRTLSTRRQEHVWCLYHRIDHLTARIANSDKDLSWDKQERAALLWALECLADYAALTSAVTAENGDELC
jgi:hypothetical protein